MAEKNIGFILSTIAIATASLLALTYILTNRNSQDNDNPNQIQQEHRNDIPQPIHQDRGENANVQIENNQLIFTKPNNHKIHAVQGDITKLKDRYNIEVDAIVNAANQQLDAGGGVCGAIFRAAHDRRLQQECHDFPLIEGNIRCRTGNAVSTGSYNLDSQGVKGIIHTPGPVYNRGQNEICRQQLRSCYEQCLRLVVDKGWKSVAFPSISTATYGYPIDEASEIAVNTVNELLPELGNQIDNVYFVCFDNYTYNRYVNLLTNN